MESELFYRFLSLLTIQYIDVMLLKDKAIPELPMLATFLVISKFYNSSQNTVDWSMDSFNFLLSSAFNLKRYFIRHIRF